MKNLEEIKKEMIAYVESDISELSELDEEKEAMAFINRVRGQLGLMNYVGIIDQDEQAGLYDKLSKARENAENNIKNLLEKY